MSTAVLNHVWNTSKAKGSTLLVLVVLADNANDDGFSYYSLAKIAKKARLSPDQARKHIKSLEALDEVLVYERKVHRDSKAEQYTNVYQVVMPGIKHQLPHLVGLSDTPTPRKSSAPLALMQVPPPVQTQVPTSADASTPLVSTQVYPSIYPSVTPSPEKEEEDARKRAPAASASAIEDKTPDITDAITPASEEKPTQQVAQRPHTPPSSAPPPLSPVAAVKPTYTITEYGDVVRTTDTATDDLYEAAKREQMLRGLGFRTNKDRDRQEVEQMYYQAVVNHPLYHAYIEPFKAAYLARRKLDGKPMTEEEVDNLRIGIEPRTAKKGFSILSQLESIGATPDQMTRLVKAKIAAGRLENYDWAYTVEDIQTVRRSDVIANTVPSDDTPPPKPAIDKPAPPLPGYYDFFPDYCLDDPDPLEMRRLEWHGLWQSWGDRMHQQYEKPDPARVDAVLAAHGVLEVVR